MRRWKTTAPAARSRSTLTRFEVTHKRTNAQFRKYLAALPAEIRRQARVAYVLFRTDPRHPSLKFKRIQGRLGYVSVRVGGSYRAVGRLVASDEVVWVWIGPHEQYERVLSSL